MGTCTLTGAALTAEARRLAIPGRSRMSADELRQAIGRETRPAAPLRLAPWKSSRGKHIRPRTRRRSA